MFGATSNSPSNPFIFGSKSASNGMSNQPAAGFGGASSTGGVFGQNASSSSTFPSSGTGGLFGTNSAKPAASGGLFGTANSAPQNTTGGGLFANNNTMCTQNNNNASKVFFGNASNTPNTQQNSTAGNVFGGASSGLGNTNTTNNPGGLFGSSTNNPPNSGGLFGLKPAAPASAHSRGLLGSSSNPGGTGGIFGNSTNNTGTTGLLGGTTTTNTPGGIFVGGQKPTPTSLGLFGGLSNTSGNLFGGLTQQQPHQPQQIQLTSMTRFSDLSPELKNELQELDMYIEKQQLIASMLHADIHKHNDLVRSIPRDIEYLHTRVSSIKLALRHDSDQLHALKSVNDELTEDIGNIMHLILQLATPGTKLSSSFHINEYFVKRIKKYRELLASYERVIRESLNATSGLERTCNESNVSIYNVVEIVKNQYSVFMELCEVVARLHGEVERLGI